MRRVALPAFILPTKSKDAVAKAKAIRVDISQRPVEFLPSERRGAIIFHRNHNLCDGYYTHAGDVNYPIEVVNLPPMRVLGPQIPRSHLHLFGAIESGRLPLELVTLGWHIR